MAVATALREPWLNTMDLMSQRDDDGGGEGKRVDAARMEVDVGEEEGKEGKEGEEGVEE